MQRRIRIFTSSKRNWKQDRSAHALVHTQKNTEGVVQIAKAASYDGNRDKMAVNAPSHSHLK